MDPRDIPADTGHAEADRLIGRLASSDPDFNDCTDAAVLIRQLVVEHKGPDHFATWKDAAVDERAKRVALQIELDRLRAGIEQEAAYCDEFLVAVGSDGKELAARLRALLEPQA